MIISWMMYSIAVALLIGCAALAAERMLRLYRKPARWVWVIALLAAVLLPGVGHVFPDVFAKLPSASVTDNAASDLAATMWHLPRQFAASAASGFVPRDSLVLAIWLVTTLVLLTLYTWSLRRLHRDLRACSVSMVGGIPVLVSAAIGPAVVGLKRQAIVLPSWVLDCEEEVRALIARHELEHVRKGDQHLQLGVLLVVLLLPWNLALWWYSARLRLAVEVDCDLRLLNGGASVRVYSRLLLEVGMRLGRAPLTALAFSRNRSSLFRRIQLMTFTPRKRSAQAALAATATLTLALLACETPVPSQPAGGSDALLAETTSGSAEPDTVTVVVAPRFSLRENDGSAEAMPLIVVDDVLMDRSSGFDLQSLDPDAIERIEVIKGGAATELYGERAAEGVIKIYMKMSFRTDSERSPGG